MLDMSFIIMSIVIIVMKVLLPNVICNYNLKNNKDELTLTISHAVKHVLNNYK
jgi:hydrogenase-4 membrane subunit HyfE